MEVRKPQPQVVNLHEQAADNLRFIRAAMSGAEVFTGVSGRALVFCGLSALVTAWFAAGQEPFTWLGIWMAELLVAAPAAFMLMHRKASLHGQSLLEGNGRKLLLAFLPALLLGGVLTLVALRDGDFKSLPGLWLALYGLGVTTAGAWSVKPVPFMGASILLLGGVTLLTPVNGDLMLALGFGLVHLAFGIHIWRAHGG